MQIVLHPGPHKTGTTALQVGLLELHGSESPQPVWYPTPPRSGPGHATLAWACLGLRGMARSPAPVRELISQAQGAGCRTLIFSSEEFCRAFPADLPALAQAFAGAAPVHLVFTLSPVIRRAVSSWQETLKHRASQPLEQFLEAAQQREDVAPGLRPDLVARFCEAFPQARASVVVSSSGDDPAEIFRRFAAATGVDVGGLREQAPNRNRSLGAVEAEVMRGLNAGLRKSQVKLDHPSYMALRNRMIALFGEEEWRSRVPRRAIALPERWAPVLAELAGRTVESLRGLAARGRIEVQGDLAVLGQTGDS